MPNRKRDNFDSSLGRHNTEIRQQHNSDENIDREKKQTCINYKLERGISLHTPKLLSIKFQKPTILITDYQTDYSE